MLISVQQRQEAGQSKAVSLPGGSLWPRSPSTSTPTPLLLSSMWPGHSCCSSPLSPAVSLAPPSPPVSLTFQTAVGVAPQGESSNCVSACLFKITFMSLVYEVRGHRFMSWWLQEEVRVSFILFEVCIFHTDLQLDLSCFSYTQNMCHCVFISGGQLKVRQHMNSSCPHFIGENDSCPASLCSNSIPENCQWPPGASPHWRGWRPLTVSCQKLHNKARAVWQEATGWNPTSCPEKLHG